MFRGVEWQGEAQGLGYKLLLTERSLHVEVVIRAFMRHVCCRFIFLAKRLPSCGIQLHPLAKGLFQLGLTIHTSTRRAEEGHKTLT